MRLKNLLRYPLDIRRAQRLLASRPRGSAESLDRRPIALDLRTSQWLFDCGRHLACLAHHAGNIGSPLFIRSNRELLAGIARKPYGRMALANPTTSWLPTGASLATNTLVLCDFPCDDDHHARQMMIGRDFVDGSAVMPYPMHPNTLLQLNDQLLIRLREANSRRGIFFAGNQKTKYDNAQLENDFAVMSRPRVLRTMTAHFASRIAASPQTSNHPMPIVLRDVRSDPVAPKDWLPTLSKARFFLACPGASQPICHNVIEAMSVGTIPIIEYGDRLHPALVDGVNAICFSGEAGLRDAVARIDQLSSDSLATLHENVIQYYEAHLRGDQFLEDLRDGRYDSAGRQVWMPFHSENFFDAIGRDHLHHAA